MTTREFLDAFNKITPHGWLTIEEAMLLVTWAETTQGPMVEVGCYQGRSAMLLAQLKELDGDPASDRDWGAVNVVKRVLHCVDPWDDSFSSDYTGDQIYHKFRNNIAMHKDAIIRIHRCRVEDWKPVDAEFVYLDGDHSYNGTRSQIGKAFQCNPKIIVIHDIADSGGGLEVKRAALEMMGPWTEKMGVLAVWKIR
jgi:hypothetical protein